MSVPKAAFECKICFEHPEGDSKALRLFTCGHGYCDSCLGRMEKRKRGQPKERECPECRQWSVPIVCRVPFGIQHPEAENCAEVTNRVLNKNEEFVSELADARTRTTSIVENVRKMGAETDVVFVARAARKAGRVIEVLEHQNLDIQTALRSVLQQFQERTIPMFKQSHDLTAKLKAALEEKTTLRDQITMLKRTEADSLREKRSLENELRAAREHASRADEEAEKALAQAERATKETIELRERLAKLDAVDSELKQQREEVSKWKGKTANMKALLVVEQTKVVRLKKKLEDSTGEEAAVPLAEDNLVVKETVRKRGALKENTCEDHEGEIPKPHLIDLEDDFSDDITTLSIKNRASYSPWERAVRVRPAQLDGSPVRPKFQSTWNLSSDRLPVPKSTTRKRKASEPASNSSLPFVLGVNGKPTGTLATGPKKSRKVKS